MGELRKSVAEKEAHVASYERQVGPRVSARGRVDTLERITVLYCIVCGAAARARALLTTAPPPQVVAKAAEVADARAELEGYAKDATRKCVRRAPGEGTGGLRSSAAWNAADGGRAG